MDKDLNEDTLLEAIVALGHAEKPTHLIVTEEGIEYMAHRIATEPEFRKAVKAHADQDPEYRAFLEEVGIVL